ncbi:MAG TPA: putative Ig domain-containing protein [Solirubrobacteraceae bacterium]|jgi:hypothetical protein|nr:putative Ig domain-containing protein [Solirubrobacteraceae bacterium]
MAALAAFLVVAVVLAGAPRATAAVSTPSWVPVSPQSRPPGRDLSAAAYDPGTRQFVVFGGIEGPLGNPLGDTWLWQGLSWAVAKPATAPAPRYGASMAYDPATGQLILTGGTNGTNSSSIYNDTWTWNGTNWVQLHPATNAPAVFGAAMAYDPATRQIVMFGGRSSSAYTNSTWAWTGTNWVQQSPATIPAPRDGASMAWDATTSQMVMFAGGHTGGAPDFDDTWVWTGTNWSQQHPATSPPARDFAVLVFDPATGQMLLASGLFAATGQAVNDVWTWSGSTWTRQTPAQGLPPRAAASAGYDAATDQLIVFAGVDSSNPFNPLNDVWTWTRFVIAEPFLPAGTVGLPYPGRLDAVAGTGAVTWSVSSGTLPTGLSLAQTGALTGIPQTAGRFSFTVSVTDSAGHSASRAYTVTINPSPRAGVWVSDATNSVLRAFALGASGNSAPTVTLGGSVSQLNGPDALVLDPTGGLYVANGNTASINYYAAGASGNTAPTRVISGPYTGLGVPDGLALDGAGRLYVANASASSVTVYPASANGNQVPSQTISGLLTGLRQPTGVTIDAAGRIWVTDYANNSLLEFAAGATGDAAPLQKITGPDTLLTSPVALVQNSQGQLLVSNLYGQSVTGYANAGPYDDTPPSYRILGASSQLDNPEGLDVDAADDVYVANEFGGVNEYALNQFTAPYAILAGTATGLRSPRALAVAPPMQIVTRTLPAAGLGRRYTTGVFAVLAGTRANWRIVHGRLPAGLRLSRRGRITGVPRRLGSSSFTVQAPGALAKLPAMRHRLTLSVRRVPTVAAVSPARGRRAGGTRVTVSGTGFATARGATIIRFGRLTASGIRCRSRTTCTARVPAHAAGRVAVTVVVDGLASAASRDGRFTYAGEPAQNPNQPHSGPAMSRAKVGPDRRG